MDNAGQVEGLQHSVAVDNEGHSALVRAVDGELPLIISAPHGGGEPVPGVAPRRGIGLKDFWPHPDAYTLELAEELATAIYNELGARPFTVIALFHRQAIDANREPEDAFESPAAAPHYKAYHSALRRACDVVSARFGGGVLIDLHGQSTTINAIYRGTCQGLSCQNLLRKHGSAALTGPSSFFGVLAAKGYQILPRSFGSGIGTETQFRGGFTCTTYGTQRQPLIDSIQLETGNDFRTTPEQRRKTATDFAAAIKVFLQAYYLAH